MDSHKLTSLYRDAHNLMRNVDGLQPQESFDELLKFLFYKETQEASIAPELRLGSSIGAHGRFASSIAAYAKRIRADFKAFVKAGPPAIKQVWPDARFKLSDDCLAGVAEIFAGVNLSGIALDVRSAALREFVPPEIRKGLGIYLTPDEVVRATVEIMAPQPRSAVLDPACGSGTFLLEVARHWEKQKASKGRVSGIDKNPRMMVLADLNLGHVPWLKFDGQLLDSLFDLDKETPTHWFNRFDYVLTNPPFGVYIDASLQDAKKFQTCVDSNGRPYTRQQSEIVFLEQCLRLLRPGGKLAIVLPRSVVTNFTDRITEARDYFGTQGHVEGVMTLPPETFYATGTQTNTVVLFVRKYAVATESAQTSRLWLAEIRNCGYDSTGRTRAGSDLASIAEEIRHLLTADVSTANCRWLGETRNSLSFAHLPELLASGTESPDIDGVPLSELATLITTGRTPSRSAYTDSGLFLVKVGNLSGKGIDWAARDRNFISPAEREKRRKSNLLIRTGDILLTSSAHSPVYIAKKVDVVTEIPQWVGGEASFVGEVMLIRPNAEQIDPFVLLAFLRHPAVVAQIQRAVRGQTAHLHPRDIGSIKVPNSLLGPAGTYAEIAKLLREEATLSEHSNVLTWRISEKLGSAPVA